MAHILLVDDEQNVLNALRRELAGEHAVEAFSSPQKALVRAKNTAFDLVISDFHMPDMDGITFLMTFAKSQPDAARLILSGQADMDALIDAINVSHAYAFIEKPWDAHKLSATICQALSYRAALLENKRLAEAYQRNHVERPEEAQMRQYHVLMIKAPSSTGTMIYELSNNHESDSQPESSAPSPQNGPNITFKIDRITMQSEILQSLEQGNYDLVIADIQLLNVDCVPLLQEMLGVSPQSAYILVGNQIDIPTLSKLINQMHIDDFLKYPFNRQELRMVALRCLRDRDLRLQNLQLANTYRQKVKLANTYSR